MLWIAAEKVRYTLPDMAEIFKNTLRQILPILITAFCAAGISALQGIASAHGACPAPGISPAETGGLAAAIKAAHQAIVFSGSGKV